MGFSKYVIQKKQVSTDRGVTWVDVEPSETQHGQLLGTYRTLLECEDVNCDLEEYRYELEEVERPDTYCGVKIPYGYAETITFTSGAIICGVKPIAGGGCQVTWDTSHALQYSKYLYEREQGYNIDIGTPDSKNSDGSLHGTCTARVVYKVVDLHGDALEGLTEPNCCSCCNTTTCFKVNKYMPWVGKKIKRVFKKHYKRDHCSEEWYLDEEYVPIDMGFGERWVPIQVGSSPQGKYWQHQLVVMENDVIIGWENEGSPLEYDGSMTIDTNGFDLISELYNDGQYYLDMSSLSGSSVDYIVRVGANASGYAISTSSASRIVTTNDANTTINSSIRGSKCKVFSDQNGDFISTNVYCIGLLSTINTPSESGYRSFVPAKIKDTNVSGMVSTQFDIFIPLSNYQVRWVDKSDDYFCHSYNKYKVQRLEFSSDGTNWQSSLAERVGDKIEDKSPDCGYSDFKVFIDTNEYNESYIVNCDGSIKLEASEIPQLNSENTYSLDFGSCITQLGESLFESKGITKVRLQGTISQWGDNCFRNNKNLVSTISFSGSTKIGANAFYGCTNADFTDFGNTLTSIGAQAFYGCSSISEYAIPDSVLSVGEGAFSDTTVITQDTNIMNRPRSCYIGTGIIEIPNSCFQAAGQIQSVNIPSNVRRIGDYAFDNCVRIMSLTLNEGLEYIGAGAFRKLCYVHHYHESKWGETPVYSGLTSVDIPLTVTEIGDGAFANCCMLGTVNMNSIHPPIVGTGVFTQGTITIPPEADLEEWKTDSHWSEYASMIRKRS